MSLKKYDEAKKLGEYVVKIIKAAKTLEMVRCGLKELFTRITDPDKVDEYNKKYSLQEIAECKALSFKRIRLKDEHIKLDAQVEIYLYDKAPKGLLIALTIFNVTFDKTYPAIIDLYIDERNI